MHHMSYSYRGNVYSDSVDNEHGGNNFLQSVRYHGQRSHLFPIFPLLSTTSSIRIQLLPFQLTFLASRMSQVRNWFSGQKCYESSQTQCSLLLQLLSLYCSLSCAVNPAVTTYFGFSAWSVTFFFFFYLLFCPLYYTLLQSQFCPIGFYSYTNVCMCEHILQLWRCLKWGKGI